MPFQSDFFRFIAAENGLSLFFADSVTPVYSNQNLQGMIFSE